MCFVYFLVFCLFLVCMYHFYAGKLWVEDILYFVYFLDCIFGYLFIFNQKCTTIVLW